MANNKFELTDEMNSDAVRDVYRIRALKDFNDVKAGDLGGFIESEENLSFEENDTSWVYDDSIVTAGSRVEQNSIVSGNSSVHNGYVGEGSKVINNSDIDNGDIKNSTIDSTNSVVTNYTRSTIKNSDVYHSNVYDSEIEDSHLYDSYIEDSKMSNGASITYGGLSGESATAETHPHIYEDAPIENFTFFKPQNEESQDIELTDDDLSDLNDLGKGLER